MIEMTDATPCADCPHERGAHFKTYNAQHVGCVACECDGFMLTPSKPEPVDEALMDRLAQKGMTIFREIVDRKNLESRVAELDAEVKRYSQMMRDSDTARARINGERVRLRDELAALTARAKQAEQREAALRSAGTELNEAVRHYLFVKQTWHSYGPNLGFAQKRLESASESYQAALAASGGAAPAEQCRCARPLIHPGDLDPWCEGCNMSASTCDCAPDEQEGGE